MVRIEGDDGALSGDRRGHAPHDAYIEPFLGGGAIMKRKPPAIRNIGIDLDRRAMPEGERLAAPAAVMAAEAE